MYLDAAEERMLWAIVQSAVVAAAAGYPFFGEFHRFAVRASCLCVHEHGVAEVRVTICRTGMRLVQLTCGVALFAGEMPAYVPPSRQEVGQSCGFAVDTEAA